MKIYIHFLCVFLSYIGYSQVDKVKNVIIVNTNIRSITNTTPHIQINGVSTPRLVYKSFVVQKQNSDSIEIKIPYNNILLKKKEKTFRFSLKEKNNYFIYTYHGVIAVPFVKQVTGDDLVKLKKEEYVQTKIKEFGLE
jgi:redox-sensitive bicupin YhaK (pirin superfamily)